MRTLNETQLSIYETLVEHLESDQARSLLREIAAHDPEMLHIGQGSISLAYEALACDDQDSLAAVLALCIQEENHLQGLSVHDAAVIILPHTEHRAPDSQHSLRLTRMEVAALREGLMSAKERLSEFSTGSARQLASAATEQLNSVPYVSMDDDVTSHRKLPLTVTNSALVAAWYGALVDILWIDERDTDVRKVSIYELLSNIVEQNHFLL